MEYNKGSVIEMARENVFSAVAKEIRVIIE